MDNLTPEDRYKTMFAVKASGSALERAMREALEACGLTGLEYNRADLYGKPDIVHEAARVAVFLDSCFWHGCPRHLRRPASNTDYWRRKIARNRRRDRLVTATLRAEGWRVFRIWEHSARNPRARRWWTTRIANALREGANEKPPAKIAEG